VTPNRETTEVALTINTAWLTSEGIMLRMACGRTTVVMAPTLEKPSERAAWNCALGTVSMPPRTISMMVKLANSVSEIAAEVTAENLMP